MRSLKIGINICGFAPKSGGLQAHAEKLAKYLQADGHRVCIITRSATRELKNSDYLLYNEEKDEVFIRGLPIRNLKYPAKARRTLWLVSKLNARPPLEQFAIKIYRSIVRKTKLECFKNLDVIHHVGETTQLNAFAALEASLRFQSKLVVQPTCHPFHYGDKMQDLLFMRHASMLLLHTNYEREYFKKKGFNCPLEVVGNGIEDRTDGNALRFSHKYGVKGNFILYVGRKDFQKGYHLLVEAFKIVRKKMPMAQLVCMGPSSGNSLVDEPGVFDFDFMSEDDKHDALSACTCLCVPSVGESFGIIFMEAGLYGKPVVGRNVPVLRELWDSGVGGLLVGQMDYARNEASLDANQLAQSLINLLADHSMQKELGSQLRRIALKFTWDNVVKKFEESYKIVLS